MLVWVLVSPQRYLEFTPGAQIHIAKQGVEGDGGGHGVDEETDWESADKIWIVGVAIFHDLLDRLNPAPVQLCRVTQVDAMKVLLQGVDADRLHAECSGWVSIARVLRRRASHIEGCDSGSVGDCAQAACLHDGRLHEGGDSPSMGIRPGLDDLDERGVRRVPPSCHRRVNIFVLLIFDLVALFPGITSTSVRYRGATWWRVRLTCALASPASGTPVRSTARIRNGHIS